MSKSVFHLLLSQAVANLADVFCRVVVIANVFVISGSVMATSVVPILIGLASFVASFLVPLVTRRVSLHRVLFLTQLGKTVLLAILFFVLSQSATISILLLYLLVALISLLDGFAAPVSYAIVPHYAQDLGKANAALSMSSESVQLVGWGLGGLLFASLGLHLSSLIVVGLFTLATLLMMTLPPVKSKELPAETSLETLTKGWKLVVREPKLRLIVQANLLEILANTVWVSSVLLVFVTDILHQTESYWGYANTAYSLGILAGGFLVYRWSESILRHKWQSMVASLLATAVATVLVIGLPYPVAFLALSLLVGFFSQVKEIPESVLVQEGVDEADLVNVYSVLEVLSTLAFSGFIFLVSALTDRFGVVLSFWLTVACLLLEAILIFKQKQYLD